MSGLAEAGHVGRLAVGLHTVGFCDLHGCRGVGVCRDDVSAVVDQGLSRCRFLSRVEPGEDPDDFDFNVGVVLLGLKHEGVDATDYFRDRERSDVTDLVGLGDVRGDVALNHAAFVETATVGRDVFVGADVAGGVLELNVRVVAGDFVGRVHETEGGGEDQVVAGLSQLGDGFNSLRTFWHVLQRGRGEAVHGFDGLTADVVAVGPAEVTGRAYVNEADFGLGLCRGCDDGTESQCRRQEGRKSTVH